METYQHINIIILIKIIKHNYSRLNTIVYVLRTVVDNLD